MTSLRTTDADVSTRPYRPNTLALGLARGKIELKTFFRNREAVVFTMMFPVLVLVLFASVFHGEIGNTGVDIRQTFIAGIIATGIMSSSFNSLAISIAVERHDGTLKRLAGTPMPKGAYFVGKIVQVLVVGASSTIIMLILGVVFYGLELPSTIGRWFTILWVFVLGAAASSLMGIAYSRLPRDGKTAPAYVTPPYIVLQFISGVFFLFSDLSRTLQLVASVFPLRWMASGLRAAFLPDSFQVQEPGNSWNLGIGAAVLVAWIVVGFVLSRLTFRFTDEDR